MTVSEYKKRAGGLTDIPASRKRILDYQSRRDKRLKDRGLVLYKNKFDFFRTDADGDDDNNQQEKEPKGHGNTKLPFGLCRRYGIEIGKDWGPREAWDALAGKGITPDSAFSHLEKGEDPGEPDVDKLLSSKPTGEDVDKKLEEEAEKAFEEEAEKEVSSEIAKPDIPKTKKVKIADDEYEVTGARSGTDDGYGSKTWVLEGKWIKPSSDMEVGTAAEDKTVIGRFTSKEEMYRYLKKEGVDEFEDPETGEVVNPQEMDLPPKKTIVGTGSYSAEYGDIGCRKTHDRRMPWSLWAERVEDTDLRTYTSWRIAKDFKTKEDMMYWLREKGVEEVKDPETKELVNPQTMDLPERDLVWDGCGYKKLSIGLRDGYYTIAGEYLDGRKAKIMDFGSLVGAQEWLKGQGISEDKVKLSPALKKREAERVSWLTSDKTEYITGDDGKKYGDLRAQIVGTGYHKWLLTGESEDGWRWQKYFSSKAEMMKFLKEQGCEKVKVDKEGVNPLEYEAPQTVATIGGKDYQEIGMKMYGDSPFLYGIDLDGEEKTIDSLGYKETVFEFFDKLKREYGLSEEDLKMSDDDASKLELRKEADKEKEQRRKEFEEKATDLGGYKLLNPYITKDSDGDLVIQGHDKEGELRSTFGWSSTWTSLLKKLDQKGVSLDALGMSDEIKKDYEEYKKRKETFDQEAVRVGDYKLVSPEFVIDSYGDWRLMGYGPDGDKLFVTGDLSIDKIEETATQYGLDIDSLVKGEEAKRKYGEYKKAAEKFDKESVQLGKGKKVLNPYLFKDTDGTYEIRGTDRAGRTRSYSAWMDMYDMDDYAKREGFDINEVLTTDELKKDYAKYKKARETFDKEAIDLGGKKYAGCEITYNPTIQEYELKGRDARGRESLILSAANWRGLEDWLDRQGEAAKSIPLDDAATKRKEKALKAKELIDTGSWYSMGGRDTAYTDLQVVKHEDTGSWGIVGKDMDGKEVPIGTPKSSWDEAISEVEKQGVKDYKVISGGKDIGKPKWGMHGVMLMRKPDGGFIVYADSKRYGKRAVMYEDPKEENARKWLEDNGVPASAVKTRGMNPNDDVQRTHTAKSLENYDTYRMNAIEGSFLEDLSQDEKQDLANMLTDVFKTGDYRAARGLNNFGNIIEKGYKSQIETGTAGYGASTSKSGRKECSRKMYGHDGSLQPDEYEKMGYLAQPDDAEDYDDYGHPFYGPMTLTFKKDRMKDRVTYTWGDSLNTTHRMACAGYAGENPTIEGMSSLYDIGEVRDAIKAYKQYSSGAITYSEMFKKIKNDANNRYIELQFNGPVTADDIEKASWKNESDLRKTFNHMSSAQRKRVLKILKDKGIKLIYRKDYSSPFVDAWDYIEKHYPDDIPK